LRRTKPAGCLCTDSAANLSFKTKTRRQQKNPGATKNRGPSLFFSLFSPYPVFPFCSFFFSVAGEPDPKVSRKGGTKEKKKRNGKEINDLNLSEQKR